MTTASLLIVQLRTNGVSLRSEGTRLIVEAPSGVITPDLREQMTHLKPQILSALEAETLASEADSVTTKAIPEIALLLAAAYRRFTNIPQVRNTPRPGSGDPRLANSDAESVHGVVP
jgi:TubC N-terminal docking domain